MSDDGTRPRGDGPRPGERPSGGRPGERPNGPRPGERPSGDRPDGGRPGERPSGGRPDGGRPDGDRVDEPHAPTSATPTGDEPTRVDRSRPGRLGRPVDDDAPFADDPTEPADGLDPGEEGRVPQASRHHGGVIDPDHPDYFTTEHRRLPDPTDPLDQPERRLVVDDYESRTTGAVGTTQPAAPPPDPSTDPRRDLPLAEPDST